MENKSCWLRYLITEAQHKHYRSGYMEPPCTAVQHKELNKLDITAVMHKVHLSLPSDYSILSQAPTS